jgi:hypothetical protein
VTDWTWVRTVAAELSWVEGTQLIAAIPIGSTFRVAHFGWGFYGDTSTDADLSGIASNLEVMGLVTTVGDGTESVPNARTQASNQDPPTQRWVYWEGRAPRIAAYDSAGTLVLWADSGGQEPVETKGQVSAKSVPEGDTLNLWASWAAGGDWDASGTAKVWFYASIGYAPSVT